MMRRFILICTVLLSLCAQIGAAKTWDFDVYLDQQKIGKHAFTLNGNQLISKAIFNVKLLWISAYQYAHTAQEYWKNDCLTSLEANTVENKSTFKVLGQQQNDAFNVSVNNVEASLPACVMTFAYWNPAILKQKKILNPQNAEYLDMDIQFLGDESITVQGKNVLAEKYKLVGQLAGKNKLNILVWYNKNKDWLALESTTPEGYKIEYKLNVN